MEDNDYVMHEEAQDGLLGIGSRERALSDSAVEKNNQ